jgi:hypothetical protein
VRNFSATADYAVGDLVARGGDIYRAAVAVTAGPWKGTDWTDIVHEADRHHGVTLFDPSKSYLQNERVANNGEIYRANAVVNAHAFNAAEWTKISPTPVTATGVTPFSATATYAKDDLVSNAGKIYRAIAAIATAGPWNSTQWEDVSTPSDAVQAFDATNTYAVNALVTNGGKIYRCTMAGTTGAFDATKWNEIGAATLSAATASALGGVFATPRVARQFVSGVSATGALKFDPVPVATAADLGGVFATPRVARQFVSGVSATGALNFDAVPVATAADLGGVRATAPVAGRFVTGIAADGNLTFGTHHIISGSDPDPAQGAEDWLWLKV